MPSPSRRIYVSPQRRAMYRRRRIAVASAAVALGVLVYLLVPSGGSSRKRVDTRGPVAATAVDAPHLIPAAEAGVMPWSLAAALSREVVLPGGGSQLLVAGGLDSAQGSVRTVFDLDVTNGNKVILGDLPAPVHDGAGAVVGANVDIFAGGSPTTVDTVQQFAAPPGAGIPAPAPASWAPPAKGAPAVVPGPAPVSITGESSTTTSPTPLVGSTPAHLPSPRSDHSAVTIGAVTYIVGGYDGTAPSAGIWSTTDGATFKVVGQLAIPVRYPATVAAAGRIFLFGGEQVGGAQDGAATAAVQVFDPATGKTAVVGSLPQPLAGASAFVLGGNIYIAGGVGNTATTPPKLSSAASGAIWAWDQKADRALAAGKLPVAVAYAGSAVDLGRGWMVGGEDNGQPVATVEAVWPNPAFGVAGAPGAGSPYFGYRLLIADRGNDRLLVMAPGDQIDWTYPSVFAAAPPGGFYFPDDAFFARNGTEIVSNQERNHTIVIIAFPSGQVLWQYGHPLTEGSQPGYLSWPDDAYVLKDGTVTVADDRNCRVLFINPDKTIAGQIGQTGLCTHAPPDGLALPNGDTPLANGDYLVSEIQGQWIDEYTRDGQLVWSTHLAMHYPSDPQQIGPDLYLVSDYSQSPGGAIDEFNREGQILYHFQPAQGLTRMNQPSLTELLPSGVFMTNDDYRDRMVAFDPPTGALVWQYGVADSAGTGPGYLNTPDGFDLLAPDGSTPTHPATG